MAQVKPTQIAARAPAAVGPFPRRAACRVTFNDDETFGAKADGNHLSGMSSANGTSSVDRATSPFSSGAR